jgi:hypothetical protein
VNLELADVFRVLDPDTGVRLKAVVIDPDASSDIVDPPGYGLLVGDRFLVTDSEGEELTAVVLKIVKK